MFSAQNSSLLKAIDRWENEGGATGLTEMHLRARAISRTGALANSRTTHLTGFARNPQDQSSQLGLGLTRTNNR
jgi:hypothetical protein